MNDTKEYIIDQAYTLFLSHSYEAVTISDISKAVGLTKGALYHHFINKEEVFKAVIDKYLIIDLMEVLKLRDKSSLILLDLILTSFPPTTYHF
jgi:AcrR family transcriptional regulator